MDNQKGLKTQKKKKTQSIKYIPTFAIHFVIKILSNEKTTFFCPTHIELGNKVIISFCKMHRGRHGPNTLAKTEIIYPRSVRA